MNTNNIQHYPPYTSTSSGKNDSPASKVRGQVEPKVMVVSSASSEPIIRLLAPKTIGQFA